MDDAVFIPRGKGLCHNVAAMNKTHRSLWRPGLAARFQRREAYRRKLGSRLPMIAMAAGASLGLFCGSAQAGRWLPTIENPYCPITTYTLRDVSEQAASMMDGKGRPIIVVNLRTLGERPSYSKFLMAHECCHHTLGHVVKFRKGLGGQGARPFLRIAPELSRMELEADCCAIRLLRDRLEADSIDAARSTMVTFGKNATGAYYPTGDERAANIVACAAADE